MPFGWINPPADWVLGVIFIDPEAWCAVGKVEGWKEVEIKYETVGGVEGNSLYKDDTRIAGNKPWGGGNIRDSFVVKEKAWQHKMHRMIDALAEGKSISEFLESL